MRDGNLTAKYDCICDFGYYLDGSGCSLDPCRKVKGRLMNFMNQLFVQEPPVCPENSICDTHYNGTFSCNCQEDYYQSLEGGCVLRKCK